MTFKEEWIRFRRTQPLFLNKKRVAEYFYERGRYIMIKDVKEIQSLQNKEKIK